MAFPFWIASSKDSLVFSIRREHCIGSEEIEPCHGNGRFGIGSSGLVSGMKSIHARHNITKVKRSTFYFGQELVDVGDGHVFCRHQIDELGNGVGIAYHTKAVLLQLIRRWPTRTHRAKMLFPIHQFPQLIGPMVLSRAALSALVARPSLGNPCEV